MPYLIENILLNEDALFEMANIWKEDTGLPYHLWIDSKGIERGNEHCGHPRLKIQVDNNLIPVDICDDPQIPDSVLEILGDEFIKKFAKVRKYIIAYKDILLAHYYRKISDKQAAEMLKTIGKASEAVQKLTDLFNRGNIEVIEFHWDDVECLFVIELKNNIGEILDTKYADDKKDLNQVLTRLKYLYGDDIKVKEV